MLCTMTLTGLSFERCMTNKNLKTVYFESGVVYEEENGLIFVYHACVRKRHTLRRKYSDCFFNSRLQSLASDE